MYDPEPNRTRHPNDPNPDREYESFLGRDEIIFSGKKTAYWISEQWPLLHAAGSGLIQPQFFVSLKCDVRNLEHHPEAFAAVQGWKIAVNAAKRVNQFGGNSEHAEFPMPKANTGEYFPVTPRRSEQKVRGIKVTLPGLHMGLQVKPVACMPDAAAVQWKHPGRFTFFLSFRTSHCWLAPNINCIRGAGWDTQFSPVRYCSPS